MQICDGKIELQGIVMVPSVRDIIDRGELVDKALIKILDYSTNVINNATIIIILDVEVVGVLDYYIQSSVGGGVNSNASSSYQKPQQQPQQQQYGGYGQQQQQQQQTYGGNYNSNQSAPSIPQPAPYGASSYGASSYGTSAYGSNTSCNTSGGGYGGQANSKPVMRQDSNVVYTPINGLSPYGNKWIIKARITAKSDIRKWSNAKGEGTLFSIDLIDNSGVEIRATFFKDACTKFYPMLEQGQVYTFSGGQLKAVANKAYSHIKNNYEITFDSRSEIVQTVDDLPIKEASYSFVKIDSIQNIEKDIIIDVIGIVRQASECVEIQSKAQGGKLLQKRDLTLTDTSNCEIKLTLWGDKASSDQYRWHEAPICAFKGVKVGDYGGRSLGCMNSTLMTINPPLPEGEDLFRYKVSFDNGIIPQGQTLSASGLERGGVEPLDKHKTISSIKTEALGQKEKPDYATFKATVNLIKKDPEPWYCACPECKKKVFGNDNGDGWRCEKCDRTYENCNYTYVMSGTMMDHTGNSWFSFFNESATQLLGVEAQQLYEYKRAGDEEAYDRVFAAALFKQYHVKCRIKMETHNDTSRVKVSVNSISPINYTTECNQLIDAINKYM